MDDEKKTADDEGILTSVGYTFREFDSELEKVFANAQKLCEIERNDSDEIVAFGFFVRHPRYPDLTALVEYPDDRPGEERSLLPKRMIIDKADTPLTAIYEIAKYTEYLVRESVQQQHGGRPKGRSDDTDEKLLRIAQDYQDTQAEYRLRGERLLTYKDFAKDKGVSVSTVKRALKLHREKAETGGKEST